MLGLRNGDRLELSTNYRNLAALDTMAPPYSLRFWRRSAETLARRRNPLMCEWLGITQDRLAIDLMHTMHLGILLRYLSWVWWKLVDCDFFRVDVSTKEVRVDLTVDRLRCLLFIFIRGTRRSTPTMLALLSSPTLSRSIRGNIPHVN